MEIFPIYSEYFLYICFVKYKNMQENSKVEEPEAIYQRYRPAISGAGSLVFAAHKGVTANIFDDVVKLYGNHHYLAEIVDLNLKTIHKYQSQNINLSPARSELLLKLIALYKKGVTVFGNQKSFLNWLSKPAYGIDNYKPFEVIKTSDGIGLVEEELDRIQYGDTA